MIPSWLWSYCSERTLMGFSTERAKRASYDDGVAASDRNERGTGGSSDQRPRIHWLGPRACFERRALQLVVIPHVSGDQAQIDDEPNPGGN